MNPQNAKDWSEPVKNYAQVLAIIAAGWWSYHLFWKKDAPGLESRGNATSEIKWFQNSGSNEWEVDFGVVLENKGTTSFDVSKIRVRGWEFDFGKSKAKIQFFDPAKMQAGAPFFDKTYQLSADSVLPFPSRYPPGTSNANSFVWLIQPDCAKRIYFLAEFYKQGAKDALTWSTYSWGQECPPQEKPNEGATSTEEQSSNGE